MVNFENMAFRRPRIDETLLFLLGLFSTWQILQVAGFSVSTLLTVLALGYLVLTRKPAFRRDWLLLFMLVSYGISTVLSLLVSLPEGYVKAAISGGIQWVLIFILSLYATQGENSRVSHSFLRGFVWSCRVQIIWCILQVLFDKLLHINLNHFVFGQLLGMTGELTQSKDGVTLCTGLHWHMSNLIPILIFVYFYHRSILTKLLCIVLVYFINNATSIICIALCVGLDFLLFAKRSLMDQHCSIFRKVAIYIVCGIFLAGVAMPLVFPKIMEMTEYLLLRISQIANPTYGHESSAVHFNYYRFLPKVLQRLSVPEILFGSGIGTSGYRFTQLIYQFPDQIWVVESDFVNQILSCGIMGFVLHYGFLIYSIRRFFKAGYTSLGCIFVVAIFCGVFYNNQFLWFQLVELMLYLQMRNTGHISIIRRV